MNSVCALVTIVCATIDALTRIYDWDMFEDPHSVPVLQLLAGSNGYIISFDEPVNSVVAGWIIEKGWTWEMLISSNITHDSGNDTILVGSEEQDPNGVGSTFNTGHFDAY